MMAGKENSAMTILMDFAKPCKGKLIGSVILAILGALCGMIPYVAVSRGIIMICHEDYAFSKLAFLALIAFAGYQRLKAGQQDGLSVTTTPRWPMTELTNPTAG